MITWIKTKSNVHNFPASQLLIIFPDTAWVTIPTNGQLLFHQYPKIWSHQFNGSLVTIYHHYNVSSYLIKDKNHYINCGLMFEYISLSLTMKRHTYKTNQPHQTNNLYTLGLPYLPFPFITHGCQSLYFHAISHKSTNYLNNLKIKSKIGKSDRDLSLPIPL